MVCLLLPSGKLQVFEEKAPERLIFIIFSTKHILYLDDPKRKLTKEKDYESVCRTYKLMNQLYVLNSFANDAYVYSIIREYNTHYRDKTIFGWIKKAYNDLQR